MSVEIVREKPQAKYVELASDKVRVLRIYPDKIEVLSGFINSYDSYVGKSGEFLVCPHELRQLCEKTLEFLNEKENN